LKEDTKQPDSNRENDDFDLFETLGLEPTNSETEENERDDYSSKVKTKTGIQLKITSNKED